jgi:hypothetical protein
LKINQNQKKQMTKQKLVELGWTENELRNRVLSYWNSQKGYIKSGVNKVYRQLNAGFYLRDKQFLRIFVENS